VTDSSRLDAAVLSPPVRSAVRDLAIVLVVSWLARGSFVAVIGDAHSNDVGHWLGALAVQDAGRNPYETGVLNWPPLWLQVIVGVDYLGNLANVSFWSALRLYLVAIESALIVVLYLTLVSLVGAPRDAVRRALLIGIALNPVTIILVCQHGNSDVQVGLVVTLAAAALIANGRTRDVVFWLCGCVLLGVGVLAKTAPLVLAPMLAPGARLASRTGRLLGGALLLGPAILGLSVIAALVPIAVRDHVIGYRSSRGFFGLAGVAEEYGGLDASTYATVFTIAVLVLVCWLGYWLWREPPLTPDALFLLVATVFMGVVAFGPGYGAHYAYWFIPSLVATYVLLDDAWRVLLVVAYAIAGITYVVDYAFLPFLGAFATEIFGTPGWLEETEDFLTDPRTLVLVRLPLFVTYLVVIAAGIRRLSSRLTGIPEAG
jgi:hypothetical protein